MNCRRTFLIAIFIVLQSMVHAARATDPGIGVWVETRGDLVVVDVNFLVPVAPNQAWGVLTDYDRMTEFLPALEFSKIIERAGNKMQVMQKGKAFYGPFAFSYSSVREMTLQPYTEIRSHGIGGSIRKSESLTRLVPDRYGTRIFYHSEFVPNTRFSTGVTTAFVKKAMREQFEHMKQEILRRKTTALK